MRRREFITLLGGAVATWPLAAHTQQATKMPQIGVLSVGRGDTSDASLTTINAFMTALRELGYTEGLNIAFERKFADGDANKLSVLAQSEAEILRAAARLYHDLTQILRLCVSDRFKPETAGTYLLRVMARAGDAPDFSALEARVKETQAEVRRVFRAVVEGV